ncbi:MAG: tRNA lysidine(34) synthetase TilS [Bryobacteraceae bacterium]
MLLDKVRATIARHDMFSPGQRVGLAVSGGADSVCLLYLLHELAPTWDLHLSVIHIDHGIRGLASQSDAEFVRGLATRFALPFHFRRVDAPAAGDNLEQAGRRLRQQFYSDLREQGAVERIATGHTRSDQAETVLYRFLRGSGLPGLSGVRPVTTEGIVRPLLECTRPEIQTFLEERKIEWREDATNRDLTYIRNRIRHELLPQLRREYNPNLDEILANMAELARDEEAYCIGQLPPIRKVGDFCYLTTQELGGHRAAARRVVRAAIEAVKGDLRQIGFEHVEAVLQMARSAEGHGRIQIPGIDVLRSFDWIRFAPAGFDNVRERDFGIPIVPPVTVEVPGGIYNIDFQLVEREGTSASQSTYDTLACDNLMGELDWQRITLIPTLAGASIGLLELRNWKPGDRYRRTGQTHEQKIKVLFQEDRIPIWERHSWPVLTANGKILWCRKFGSAADFTPDSSTRTILRVCEANRLRI